MHAPALIFALSLSCCLSAAHGQEGPVLVPGPHDGAAAYADARQKQAHDEWGFAGAYRAGDFVYLSGVVAGAPGGEAADVDAFKESVRRTFQRADETLKAAGSNLEEVVDITSFHVWDSPLFNGGKLDHLRAVADVKKEFMPAPDPAWTAIGVSALLPDHGLVEIRMIAYSPE